MTGAEIPAIIAITAASAAASTASAVMMNQRIKQGIAMQAAANQDRQKQLTSQRNLIESQITDRAAAESRMKEREASAARGRLRAGAAMAGLSTGSGVGEQMMNQLFFDESFAKDMIERGRYESIRRANLDYQQQQLSSTQAYQSQAMNYSMQAQNPFLSGVTGGLQGLGTGLSIVGGMRQLQGPGQDMFGNALPVPTGG
jgi:hypothetical protein